MTICLRTSTLGACASAECENTEIQPLVSNDKGQPKYLKPSEDHSSAFGIENHNHRRVFTSLDFKFLEVQEIEKGIFHNYKHVDNRTQAAEYVDCIPIICQIATSETISKRQARDVEDYSNSLITIMRSGQIAVLKSLLVDCYLYTLPSVDMFDLNSSLTACVAYLRYLNSVTGIVSKSDDVNRRLV